MANLIDDLGIMSKKDKGQDVYKIVRTHFDNPAVAAAFMGNIAVETGESYDYQQKQYRGGPGRGLYQMGGGMLKAYNNHLKKNNIQDTAENQTAFIKQVTESADIYDIGAGNRQRLQGAFSSGDPEAITEAISNYLLRPGVPHMDRRKQNSSDWFKRNNLMPPLSISGMQHEFKQSGLVDDIGLFEPETKGTIPKLIDDLGIWGEKAVGAAKEMLKPFVGQVPFGEQIDKEGAPAIQTADKEGERYPKALLRGVERVGPGKEDPRKVLQEEAGKVFAPGGNDTRTTDEIAFDIYRKVFPDASQNVAWEFTKMFPFTTMGTVASWVG
jgi:hypothetical protein